MKYNAAIIPEVVHGFNVYDGNGNRQVGITDEMHLPELVSKMVTITGAGISGAYDIPVIGHYDSVTQEIPFRTIYIDLAGLIDSSKTITLNVRGAIQVTDSTSGISDMVGFRYMVTGRSKSTNLGNIKPGEVMGVKIVLEVTSMLLEIDGNSVFELDKRNNVLRIDGVDLMEKARKLC